MTTSTCDPASITKAPGKDITYSEDGCQVGVIVSVLP